MKIAICFSGHLRNFLENELSQLKTNLDTIIASGHEVDCFFSVWDIFNTTTANPNSFEQPIHVTSDMLQNALNGLNIKSIEIENFESLKHMFYLRNFHPTVEKEVDPPHILSPDGILYSTPMFYKIYKCNLLKKNYELEHGIQYDVVVRYRSNIQLLNPLHVTDVNTGTIHNSGNFNPHPRALGYTHESLMTQDMFFYGSSETMDIVCDLFNNLSRVITNHGATGPERILYDWCFLENKLKHQKAPTEIRYI